MMNALIKSGIAGLMLYSVTMLCCKSAQKEGKTVIVKIPTVSYEKDIAPIMQQSCTPCHFPETGKKKMLDTYEATADNVYDIIDRIQMPASEIKSMPYKGKKPPLTKEEIKLFKDWVAQKMPK
jgi:hypothetical protein